jgi:hypothetical protein
MSPALVLFIISFYNTGRMPLGMISITIIIPTNMFLNTIVVTENTAKLIIRDVLKITFNIPNITFPLAGCTAYNIRQACGFCSPTNKLSTVVSIFMSIFFFIIPLTILTRRAFTAQNIAIIFNIDC